MPYLKILCCINTIFGEYFSQDVFLIIPLFEMYRYACLRSFSILQGRKIASTFENVVWSNFS